MTDYEMSELIGPANSRIVADGKHAQRCASNLLRANLPGRLRRGPLGWWSGSPGGLRGEFGRRRNGAADRQGRSYARRIDTPHQHAIWRAAIFFVRVKQRSAVDGNALGCLLAARNDDIAVKQISALVVEDDEICRSDRLAREQDSFVVRSECIGDARVADRYGANRPIELEQFNIAGCQLDRLACPRRRRADGQENQRNDGAMRKKHVSGTHFNIPSVRSGNQFDPSRLYRRSCITA
jgi:hypothetical protein